MPASTFEPDELNASDLLAKMVGNDCMSRFVKGINRVVIETFRMYCNKLERKGRRAEGTLVACVPYRAFPVSTCPACQTDRPSTPTLTILAIERASGPAKVAKIQRSHFFVWSKMRKGSELLQLGPFRFSCFKMCYTFFLPKPFRSWKITVII